MGPGGAPVPVRSQGTASNSGEAAAKQFIANNMPPDLVQQVAFKGGSPDIMLAGGPMPGPGGMPSPGMPLSPGMSPAAMAGPGGGGMPYPNGAVAALGALTGNYTSQFSAARTSVRFIEPKGMKISWFIQGPDGRRSWNDRPLEAPATYNFAQAAIYRLRISDLADYPGVDLYPSLEVVPANAKAMTFLAHSSVPVSFTPDDLRMVACGNYVVKVIYLPDPQYQDIAVGGCLGELISTQLEPGVDPIAEACKRGSILVIVRLGNIDLELRHSPAMDAPPPNAPPPGHAAMGMMPPGMMAGGGMMPPPPGMMIPPAAPGKTTPTGAPTGGLPPLPPQTNPLTPSQMGR
jgi:hypothetical protein